jgi:hypothetical protein
MHFDIFQHLLLKSCGIEKRAILQREMNVLNNRETVILHHSKVVYLEDLSV